MSSHQALARNMSAGGSLPLNGSSAIDYENSDGPYGERLTEVRRRSRTAVLCRISAFVVKYLAPGSGYTKTAINSDNARGIKITFKLTPQGESQGDRIVRFIDIVNRVQTDTWLELSRILPDCFFGANESPPSITHSCH